ncbi:MAG: NAD(P)H-dependent oxidoreductase [Chitinophagaceae bacterium]|nr:NAD(P)H-dependent oxidoreductase [Chitinophagaceae bacterium]
MKIEIISGSPRENSITRRVALHLNTVLYETTDHEVGLIDMRDWNLPQMQSIFTSVDNTPEEFRSLSQRVFDADAYILVTPEYNGSYAPAMKNLLDHFPKQHHKPFGIVTASPGALGGLRAAQQLLLLVPALFGIASPYLLLVPGVEKKFDAKGVLLEPAFEHNVHNFVTEFLWLSERLVKEEVEALENVKSKI